MRVCHLLLLLYDMCAMSYVAGAVRFEGYAVISLSANTSPSHRPSRTGWSHARVLHGPVGCAVVYLSHTCMLSSALVVCSAEGCWLVGGVIAFL